MGARVGRGEITEGLDDSVDCRGEREKAEAQRGAGFNLRGNSPIRQRLSEKACRATDPIPMA